MNFDQDQGESEDSWDDSFYDQDSEDDEMEALLNEEANEDVRDGYGYLDAESDFANDSEEFREGEFEQTDSEKNYIDGLEDKPEFVSKFNEILKTLPFKPPKRLRSSSLTSCFQPKLKSSSHFSHHKIIRKYKRIARLKPDTDTIIKAPAHFKDPHHVNLKNSIDGKLKKLGTTMKMIKKNEVDPVTENPSIKTVFIDVVDGTEEIIKPKINLIKPVKTLPTTHSFSPQLTKVVLKKNSKGTFSLVTDGQNLPKASSFPKAINYTEYEKKKELEKLQPSTSKELNVSERIKAAMDNRKSLLQAKSTTPIAILPKPSTSKSSIEPPKAIKPKLNLMPSVEDLFVNEDGTDLTKPKQNLTKKSEKSDAKVPAPQRILVPDPVKYIIPQDMLMSEDDKLKILDASSSNSRGSENGDDFDEANLFIIDHNINPSSPPPKRRRKENLGQLVNNEEPIFEELSQMPPRPQANLDLIDTLAKYRVLVRSMMEKLEIPSIDFNAIEGDEYVNMYKIFRN